MSADAKPACSAKTAFWLKRLHSITGLVPLGGFVLEHLYSNSAALRGPDAYAEMIAGIWRIPYVALLEWGMIFLPIAFHMLMGLWMTWQGVWNYGSYREQRNLFFILQRVTGFYLTAFIIYHVLTTRAAGLEDAKAFYPHMQKALQHPMVFLFYLGAMMSVAFHFANGIWLGLVRWGITVSPAAQRVAARLCGGFGIVFFLAWLNVMLGVLGKGISFGLGGGMPHGG